ncbi:MAG: UDP-2,3-diacylglucosamine diphosphatase [Cytophagales bacterium]|jgi:UDP-2,3-diacylglucosamine hydrolase|nr:UDP-2,3-diacylglucosamine diphosphatase [Bacteroidota bacterium]MBS1981996.1 UDP-2,3-diacylglucosamine diphosphatase [Bacteroidota bacterium]WHZ09449.1 MAG: UDP-2,3-diacylglucosamine diphosphatase [Cytophagales bacterium]
MRINLPVGKKIYFASDFHLGVPDQTSSLTREKKIVAWLNQIAPQAQAIFLLGDIFDFWFEYKEAIPKGFIRFQGKLAELTDQGIPVYFFTGNHDMWLFDYFNTELGIEIFKEPIVLEVNDKKILVGHGDGLGDGDWSYKWLKYFFHSKICQWLFARIHPNLGIAIAKFWSRKSRISSSKREEKFNGEEKEFLLAYCKRLEEKTHHDYYIFGHRHLPLDLKVGSDSRYFNLGEWVHFSPYLELSTENAELKMF